eukprot:gnl/TRDRNA2_/TRDRNA2_65785_c0_seq1.p1 gnl/TRDRNA2_/TRDRNA2_65785_c0~~gnl/TRDRNA2_/TRDRNA2_65785_c0_seq1.p1  ORF type:complete len:273 (+),score=39.28 gnl/TRDRNA2_/TRDRNA2_65785_c0_seq1:62-880(+)
MKRVLYLVRHGQAAHNLVDQGADAYEKRRDAALADPALTELGMAQAQTASETLQKLLHESGDVKVDVVVSSTLRRALQTAEIAVPDLASGELPSIASDLAVEIQYDDIWNEPRDAAAVAADWKKWQIEGGIFASPDGRRLLESADELVRRSERLWARLTLLEGPVIVLVSHGCLLWFLQHRLSIASGEAIPQTWFQTAEVRRCAMPPHDGRELKHADVFPVTEGSAGFWKQHQRRTNMVNKARQAGSPDPSWTAKEWRVAGEIEGQDEEDDA